MRDVLRGCIAGSIAISAVRKAVGENEADPKGRVRVEVPGVEARYHAWWVVPKIVPVK